MTETEQSRPRVVVVGAGFAGLIAARELEAAGIATVVYEARDRIGGRAWTERRLGRPLELGATWVHWLQPFVWTEIVRYGQGIHPSPDPERAYWITDGTTHSGTEHDMDAILRRAQGRILERAREFFPYPHDPMHLLTDATTPTEVRERFLAADHGSVLDVLTDGNSTQEEIDLADAYWSGGYQGDTAHGSPLMAMHWASLANYDSALLDQLTLAFKLDNGMRGLYEAIAADVRGPVHLDRAVVHIRHDRAGATVTLADGEQVECAGVVLTAPTGALRNLTFDPAPTPEQQELIDGGTLSTGLKIWIKVAGDQSLIAGAPHDHPITLLRSEYYDPEEDATILVGFGPDHTAIDLTDRAAAQAMLDRWCPGLTVLACDGHDWAADRWSGQTWATLRSGQFFAGWNLFESTGTRLRFAGADWAKGWNGVCVDGAIESGITTARGLIAELRR